jgi:hypothetical protein
MVINIIIFLSYLLSSLLWSTGPKIINCEVSWGMINDHNYYGLKKIVLVICDQWEKYQVYKIIHHFVERNL